MIRRSLLVVGTLAAALAVSSCSTFTANENVASVDSHDLSQDDLQSMVDSDLGQQLLQTSPVDGQIEANSVRALINAWIQLTALTDAGIGADVDTTEIEANLATDNEGWSSAPQVMRDLAVKNIAVGTLVEQNQFDQVEARAVLLDADIEVDSRYGYWDGDSGSVLAFG